MLVINQIINWSKLHSGNLSNVLITSRNAALFTCKYSSLSKPPKLAWELYQSPPFFVKIISVSHLPANIMIRIHRGNVRASIIWFVNPIEMKIWLTSYTKYRIGYIMLQSDTDFNIWKLRVESYLIRIIFSWIFCTAKSLPFFLRRCGSNFSAIFHSRYTLGYQ